MFNLDNSFLEGLGLSDMPESEKGPFLEHLQEELEVRVGEKISAGLPEEKIEQFEKILDGDQQVITGIIGGEDFHQNELYQKILENGGFEDGSPEALGEYASMKWLKQNKPDYQDIVEGTLNELKSEVAGNREEFLEK